MRGKIMFMACTVKVNKKESGPGQLANGSCYYYCRYFFFTLLERN